MTVKNVDKIISMPKIAGKNMLLYLAFSECHGMFLFCNAFDIWV